MISSSDKISRKEEVNELFEQLGQVLEQKVEALLIGGAVMLELGLKDASGGHFQSQADRQPAARYRGLRLSGVSEDGF
jgi:hypothetical protein